MSNEICEWDQEDDDSSDWYASNCGMSFIFNDGGPVNNGFIFCPKCGKRLKEIPWQSMTEEFEDE